MANLTGQQLIAKAGKYHQAGKFSQAEKIYRQLLNANPNDLTLLRILGMLERDRKNLKAAVDWFVLAKQVSADDPIILAELALTLEQGGNPDKAMTIATEAINRKPTDISIAIFFAKMCLARGHATRAAKAIEGALDSDPNNPEAWHLLSMAANSTGTLPVPLHYAKKLIQLQQQDAQPYATLQLHTDSTATKMKPSLRMTAHLKETAHSQKQLRAKLKFLNPLAEPKKLKKF